MCLWSPTHAASPPDVKGLALLSCPGVRAVHCVVKKVVPTVCCKAVLCASVFRSLSPPSTKSPPAARSLIRSEVLQVVGWTWGVTPSFCAVTSLGHHCYQSIIWLSDVATVKLPPRGYGRHSTSCVQTSSGLSLQIKT